MAPNRSRRRASSTPARLLLLAAALAGLFAMHGVSGHGVSGMAGHAETAMTATAHPGMLTSPHPGLGVSAPSEGDHDMGLADLCLAVLGALLLVAYAGRRLRRAGVLLPVLPRPVPPTAPRARDPVPPDRSALCIRRC